MAKRNIIRNDGSPSRLKFHGFGFYIRCRGKLLISDREQLLEESRDCLSEVYEMTGRSFELDPSWDDLEMLDNWNEWYRQYGHFMSRFRDSWEDDFTNGNVYEKEQGLVERLRVLENRIGELESQINKLKMNGMKKGIGAIRGTRCSIDG